MVLPFVLVFQIHLIVCPDWVKTADNPHDTPLTERGVRQATDLGKHLSDCNIRHIFASPYSRVSQTAAAASAAMKNPLPINVESGACEWLNGDWYPSAPHVSLFPAWKGRMAKFACFRVLCDCIPLEALTSYRFLRVCFYVASGRAVVHGC